MFVLGMLVEGHCRRDEQRPREEEACNDGIINKGNGKRRKEG